MTEQERLAAALEYQQAQQPARMNPNLAAQGARGRENMMPPTSVMDERYPAFKRNQEDAEKLMLGLDIVGSAIPMAGPAVKGAKILGQAAAPQIAQALENYTFKTGMALPIDVYHGSPHRFAATAKNPLGEFDPTKIGTGEGAQAFGYGHYLAEAPSVAETYKSAVDPAARSAFMHLQKNNGNVKQTIQEVTKDLKNYEKNQQFLMPNVLNQTKQKLDYLKMQKTGKPIDIGSLYKVDLPDEVVPRMLDYDKHLTEQSPQVQKILSDYQKELGTSFGRGDQVLKEIAFDLRMKGLNDSPAAVSKKLRELGIPGIQYLGAAPPGAGTVTRNFVVFPGNEGLLNILGRE